MANISDDFVMLRALEPSDVDSLYLWENDTDVWQYGDRRAPLSRHQLWEYATTYDADAIRAGQLRLMICDARSGEAVGAVDLFDIDATSLRAQVGILVCKSQRGKGYGARALRMVSRYAADVLCLHQLWCVTASDNLPSRAAFESAGFKISGRLRSWQKIGTRFADTYIYQLML